MRIYFYESERDIRANIPCLHGWHETKAAIASREDFIVTTQMGLLSTELIDAGYKVCVYPAEGKSYEISLGPDNTCTEKEIRPAHNLFRMWEAGAFHADAVERHEDDQTPGRPRKN